LNDLREGIWTVFMAGRKEVERMLKDVLGLT
jgi:hypothetical protein